MYPLCIRPWGTGGKCTPAFFNECYYIPNFYYICAKFDQPCFFMNVTKIVLNERFIAMHQIQFPDTRELPAILRSLDGTKAHRPSFHQRLAGTEKRKIGDKDELIPIFTPKGTPIARLSLGKH